MEEVNIAIIGAGVVGLAIAEELSQHHENVVALEKHSSFGQETSSRNSEVIHSGIYYPKNSLKATLCVQGAELLYETCEKHSIPRKKTGKLIVAVTQEELGALEDLFKKGNENNAKGLQLLDRTDIKKIEPNTNALAAIYSPNTGIINSHALMKHFFNRAESNGALIAFNSEVELIRKEKDFLA